VTRAPKPIRLFVAVDLPDTAVEQLLALRPAPGPGLRITPSDQLHLTLAFLGKVDVARIEALETALAGVDFPSFAVDFQGVGSFPMSGDEFLWVGVVLTPALTALHGMVGTIVRRHGIELEERPYHPHVTLARCEVGVAAEVRDEFLRQHGGFEMRGVSIEQFSLYESRRTDTGPSYQRRRTYWLQPA
jgi:2'-5' RNA ligase